VQISEHPCSLFSVNLFSVNLFSVNLFSVNLFSVNTLNAPPAAGDRISSEPGEGATFVLGPPSPTGPRSANSERRHDGFPTAGPRSAMIRRIRQNPFFPRLSFPASQVWRDSCPGESVGKNRPTIETPAPPLRHSFAPLVDGRVSQVR